MLRYLLRIWELHRKQHPQDPLPPILPLVLYHGQQRGQGPGDFQALFGHELPTQTAEGDDTMQTFIDRYIEQGRQQGFFAGKQEGEEEGLQKGLQEGLQKGQQEVLLRLMARKFGAPTKAQHRRIRQADGETLLRWSEQVLSASTAGEALR